jgi:hypothetical protein
MKSACIAVAIVAVVLAAGCVDTVTPTPWEVVDEARDSDWVLTMGSPRARWVVGEPIVIRTELRYVGPGAGTEYFGSSSGPVAFSLEEIGGTRSLQGSMLGDCARHSIRADEPLVVAYVKGGYSADDPNAAFYTEFVADPVLRLPAGSWELAAHAVFSMPPNCGQGRTVSLNASVIVTVE